MSTSSEIRIPTHAFLPTPLPLKEPAGAEAEWEIGRCQVIRPSDEKARTLLALRHDSTNGGVLVAMRRIDAPDVRTHAQWAARFSHPNLARVFECEVAEEGAYWVTELTSGATLAEVAAVMRKVGQAVPFGLTLAVVQDAARAVAELHGAGCAHGLISHQSVAVSFEGTARLLDTGLFRCLGQGASWLEVREAMGPYFAPEQLVEGRLPDAKTDVFSLGVVLYEGLTGEKVRRAKTFDEQVKMVKAGTLVPPSRLNVAIGPALDEVIQRALSADRSKRYANARELVSALSEAASAFMWRRDLRAQFLARHFAVRKQQDEALRESASRIPRRKSTQQVPVVKASTLVDVAIPVVAMQPPVRSIAPRPSVPLPIPAPRAEKARERVRNTSPAVVALAGVLAAGVAFAASAFGPRLLPVKPARGLEAPVAKVVIAEPIDAEVERVVLGDEQRSCTDFTCVVEGPRSQAVAAAPVKVKKARKARSDDEAPLPPWLR